MTAVIVLATMLAAQGVPSAPAKGEAYAAFEQARREHQLGNYQAAAEGFARCYRATGDPTFLFDTAQSLRLAGRDAEAIAAYRGYLRERPDAPNRVAVEARIRGLEARRTTPVAEAPKVSDNELVDPVTEPSRRPISPLVALPLPLPRTDLVEKPVWRRWWFLAAVGAVVVSGVVVAATASHGTNIPGTPLGNQGIFR
jgi:hypothetical protein